MTKIKYIFFYRYVFYSLFILLLLCLSIYNHYYKPIPTKDCTYSASINFTGIYHSDCFYQGCQVGCKYFDEIKENGFKRKDKGH